MSQQPQPPTDLAGGVLFAAVAAAFTFVVTADAALLIPAVRRALQAAGISKDMALLLWPWMCLQAVAGTPQPLPHATMALTAVGGLATLYASIAGWFGWSFGAKPPDPVQHLRGRRLCTDATALRREMAQESKLSGAGIPIYPGIPLSLDRETRGLMILGSIGGGKTQILTNFLNAIIARGDRVLLYDTKGDFTAGLFGLPGVELLAPWDSRSAAWDIAKDISSIHDAQEFAVRVIPESGDNPLWGNAARMVLVGCIAYFQREQPGKWGFGDLAEILCLPYAQVRRIALSGDPSAALVLPEKPTKTTEGYIVQMAASLKQVAKLADAWANTPIERRLSLRAWALGEQNRGRVLIFQSHSRFQALSRTFTQAIIAQIKTYISDMADSNSRRIWLVLDEFPQLGTVEEIKDVLAVGRSKGIRVVLGYQDYAQLREIYGGDGAQTMASICGTSIICRSQGADTPEYLSRLLGPRQVRRYNPSASGQPVTAGGLLNASVSQNYQILDEPVVSPDEFGLLGPSKYGITAILFPGGNFVYRLTWPFSTLPGNNADPRSPASWTLPGWPHATEAGLLGGPAAWGGDESVEAAKAAPLPAGPLPAEPAARESTEIDLITPAPERSGVLPELPEQIDPGGDDLAGKLGELALSDFAIPEPAGMVLHVLEALDGAALPHTPQGASTPAATGIPRRRKLRRRNAQEADGPEPDDL